QNAETFQPLRSRGLIPSKTSDPTIQLPPRLLQPARLQFRFISAAGTDDADVGRIHVANPVCGWLLPNHLDRALVVFDARGVNLGTIMLVGNQQTRRLRWEPMPGPVRVASPKEIGNPYLRQLVRALFNQVHNAQAFLDFLEAVDKTLWTADPLGQGNSQHRSVLVGRPLAVVRAQIGLELAGSPVTDQLWGFTGQQATKDFDLAAYQVQIGHILLRNDGTIGYFVEDDYHHFRTVHPELDSDKYVQYDIAAASQPASTADLTAGSARQYSWAQRFAAHQSHHAATALQR
ncbi:MAG: hypothetical protein P8183_23975, partial [Anaerolineae bacterium]